MKKLSKNIHLTKEDIIKNGSIFTPKHIVDLVFKMTRKYIKSETVIGDFCSGYGAFIDIFNKTENRCFGTEADDKSYEFLKENFDNEFFLENSLLNVGREKYNIKENDDLIIVGNPPYNDVTSQYKNGQKGELLCDKDLKCRDMGVSFLRAYNKLYPSYICILHPLSYLIKKQNFKMLGDFRANYKLIDATIFSSKEFESIKKSNAEFPVVAALYQREQDGMDYEYINRFKFKILNDKKTFCLNEIETIDGKVPKYPTKDNKTKLQFYTQRDMNSLLRNTSFIEGPKSNGVNVYTHNLYQYSWLYFLKQNFNPKKNKFLYGNLSPLYINNMDDEIKKAVVSYAYNNCDIVQKYYTKAEIEKEYGSLKEDYSILYDELNKLYVFE